MDGIINFININYSGLKRGVAAIHHELSFIPSSQTGQIELLNREAMGIITSSLNCSYIMDFNFYWAVLTILMG